MTTLLDMVISDASDDLALDSAAADHPLATDPNWLLHRAALGFGDATAQALTTVGLTVREHALLHVLSKAGGRTQLELSTLIGLDKSVFTAAMDALTKKGLVRRRMDPRDRRARRPELTEEGWELCRRADEVVAQAHARLLAGLAPDSRAELTTLLRGFVFGPLSALSCTSR